MPSTTEPDNSWEVSGVVSVTSPSPVSDTVERLKRAIGSAGLTLFAVVDHSGGAHDVGLAMNDTKLLIFGNPRAGTPAMIASPLLGLELPSKALVWADDQDHVRVSYHDAADWQRRYAVPGELIGPLSGTGRLIETALAG